MKNRFFVENSKTPDYNGSSDLYPKRNCNLINDENSIKAAIKIQRFWRTRGFRTPATVQNEQVRKQMEQVELEKTLKNDVPERFWSWFPFYVLGAQAPFLK